MISRLRYPGQSQRSTRRATRASAWMAHWVLTFLLILLLGPSWSVPGQAQSMDLVTECTSTQRTYTVEVCITAPDPGVSIEDDTLISATVMVSDPEIRVSSVNFELNERRVLADFDPPYAFELPSSYWVDGAYQISAIARTSDKELSTPAVTDITLATGTDTTFVPDQSFTPPTGRPAEDGEPFVLAAVGDAAGGSPQSAAVADLMGSWDPNLFLYLGDVYNSGTYTEYMNWYDPAAFVGRFADITLPTIGNHEYGGSDQPRGYLDYWGNPPHYYSVDTAGWHIVSLDTNEKFNETDPESQQMRWLVEDLETSNAACTLVFFHHPVFSVGSHGNTEELDWLWQFLTEQNVTLVLAGHDHDYQRWIPLDASGVADPQGTVQLVVGTGGQSEYGQTRDDDRLAGAMLLDPGALRVELNPKGAGLQFITTDGVVRDNSVVPCDQSPAAIDDTPPSAPASVSAERNADGSVVVQWDPGLDDTGVDVYDLYRNDQLIASVPPGTAFTDNNTGVGALLEYRVVSRDAANNESAPSEAVEATGIHDPTVFFDDSFAGGSLGRWSEVNGLAVELSQGEAEHLVWMARARGGLQPAFAKTELPLAQSDPGATTLELGVRFFVIEQGDNPMTIFRIRGMDDTSLFGVTVLADRTLSLYNDVMKAGTTSKQLVDSGQWHHLVMRVSGPAQSPVLTMLLDGAVVPGLSGPVDLQSLAMATVQLGDSTTNRIYDTRYAGVSIAYLDANSPPLAAPVVTPASDTDLGPSIVAVGSGVGIALHDGKSNAVNYRRSRATRNHGSRSRIRTGALLKSTTNGLDPP